MKVLLHYFVSLTPISDDPSEPQALTPNHLLTLHSQSAPPPGGFGSKDSYVRRRWRQIQYLADLFWKRWRTEYLPLLQQRQRWLSPKKNVEVGDVVLVVDSNVRRNHWPMGKVIETVRDRKGRVRVAKVRTQSSVLERPIHKLCIVLRKTEDRQ